MRCFLFILLFFESIQTPNHENSIIILLNGNNNCLACNIAISNLFEELKNRGVNTEIYLNGLNKVQVNKINSDFDFHIESSFKVINEKEKYNSFFIKYPKLSSMNSYLIIYKRDKSLKIYNLIELSKNTLLMAEFLNELRK